MKMSFKVKTEITGMQARTGDKVTRAVGQGLFVFGNKLMTASKSEVPVDTGNLRASGTVDAPKYNGNSVEVALGYGGPSVDYAIYVHEGTDHMSGRKFLERPVNAAATDFEGEITKRVNDALQ